MNDRCSYCDETGFFHFRIRGRVKRFCADCLVAFVTAAFAKLGEKAIEEFLK